MDHHIRPKLQGPLKVRRRKRVVDHQQGTASLRMDDLRCGLEVRYGQERIAGGLEPDEARVRFDGRGDVLRIGRVDEVEREAELAQHFVEEPEGPAVDVVACDDVVSAFGQAQHRVSRGHAGGESQSVLRALEGGQALLERQAGRVLGARIFIPVPGPANAVLNVGGGLVDGRHDCPRAGIRFLAGVNGKRLELHRSSGWTCVDCAAAHLRPAKRPRTKSSPYGSAATGRHYICCLRFGA